MKPRRLVLGCASIATLLAAVVPAGAHAGYDCGPRVVAIRLEAECYSTPSSHYSIPTDPECDGDKDGEHVRPVGSGTDARWSAGSAARLPHSGCGARFDDWLVPVPSVFKSVRSCPSGLSMTFLWKIHVEVDGVYWGSASSQGPAEQCVAAAFDAGPRPTILPGFHSLLVSFQAVEGPDWMNMTIDWLEPSL